MANNTNGYASIPCTVLTRFETRPNDVTRVSHDNACVPVAGARGKVEAKRTMSGGILGITVVIRLQYCVCTSEQKTRNATEGER